MPKSGVIASVVMATRTSHAHGTPSWVDLGSPDVDKAAAFYSALFGWTVTEAGPAEETGDYRMAMLGDKAVAGLGPATDPGPPRWTTYVSVDDADKVVAAAKEAGGQVFLDPMDVLSAGRMAVIADPEGAVFAVWQPNEHIGAQLVNEPGTLCWNELNTRQLDAAKSFYEAVFGWAFEGSEGYVSIVLEKRHVGGILPLTADMPEEMPPHWLAYFAVADHDASLAKVKELGGSSMVEGLRIEGVGTSSIVSDNQGAVFSIIELTVADD